MGRSLESRGYGLWPKASRIGRVRPDATYAAPIFDRKSSGRWLGAVELITFTSGRIRCSRSQQRPRSAAYFAGASRCGRQNAGEFTSFQITTSSTLGSCATTPRT
jgi:hypothetical protein